MEGVRRSSVPSCLTNSRSVWIGATVQGTLRSHSTLNSTQKAGLEYVFVLQLTSLLREVVFGSSGLSAENVSEGNKHQTGGDNFRKRPWNALANMPTGDSFSGGEVVGGDRKELDVQKDLRIKATRPSSP